MAPQDLAALLAPVDVELFLKTCWGQTFQHVPGESGKFSDLLPWRLLNDILQQHRLEPPRLRLTREGKPVPASNYVSYQTNRKRATQQIPRLNATEFTRELREGATLVLDAVDELCPPVTKLAEAMERVFRVRIQVNAYAGWRTSHGFDLHWDDHDVFILQIAGRKDWKVYGMTRKYPLVKDVAKAEAPKTPIWEGRLEEGDLLYIPRGWWHVATPLDEPTLHLTVGVSNPTGIELLNWVVERLRKSADVRRDLPLFASAAEQQAYIERIRTVLAGGLSQDLLTKYFSELDANAKPRPKLSLPWTATPQILPPAGTPFSVKWNGAREIELRDRPGEVHLTACGRVWRFAAAARPMLDRLISGSLTSISELAAMSDAETARVFARELVEAGLLVVIDP